MTVATIIAAMRPIMESSQIESIHEAEQLTLAVAPVAVTQEDIDILLIDALSDSERAQIQAQFEKSPRSREAVELVKSMGTVLSPGEFPLLYQRG